MNDWKKDLRKYLDKQKWAKFSPAQLELTSFQLNFDDAIGSVMSENPSLFPGDDTKKTAILNETDPEKLVGYMRRSEYTYYRKELREKLLEYETQVTPMIQEKLLEYETQVTPMIQEKLLRNGQDEFIETGARFFMYTEQNPCEWILQNYSSFRSEYLKSMLCLVLGIRGTVEYIPFLKNEVARFSKAYPSETFHDGPLCGLRALLDEQDYNTVGRTKNI